jgi:uncharacterized protein (DUF1499 family)
VTRTGEIALTGALLLAMSASATASSSERNGKLEPCPETPNCVSTQAEREDQRMAPIPFEGDPAAALDLLIELLREQPRVHIESIGEHSVVTVFTTRILRFDDDVVFLIDPEEHVIHFRSASRVGRSDLGANRKRMEHLSKLFREARDRSESPR